MASPAWKMAADVAEGYVLLSPPYLKKLEPGEMSALQLELERAARDTRSQVIPADDSDAAQKRNRKLQRISQAALVLSSYRSRMRR